ncbi:MAG: hypothetical protein H8E66_25845 [Planctomycetes bacterium]|nr:hypothetical protein [Planctomycetota bacterium]
MRLTLRTMLAYLDDVLDPADAQELEQKIEESSFASGLVHRVRDSMRRMRLGAPKLDGRGLGLDPNTVADYLDSTLPPERVPEFEKVCLESDVHLAEVASCHQILTLVLGEPADVDTAMRERIYRVGHPDNRQSNQPPAASRNGARSVAAHGGASASSAEVGTAAVVKSRSSRQPSQLSPKSLAITVLLGFLLAVVALQAVGVSRLRSWIGLSSAADVADGSSPSSTETAKPEITSSANAESLSPGSGEANVEPRLEIDASSDLRQGEAAASLPMVSPIEAGPVSPALETSIDNPSLTDAAGASVVDRPPVAGGEIATGDEVAPPGVVGEVAKVDGAAISDPSERAEVAAVEPTRQVPVGSYISEVEVLARFDETAGDWFRVAPDAPVLAGQRVIALPTYRPKLLLSPNIRVTLVGESYVEFGQKKEPTAPMLKIETGRATIVPLGDPEAVVHLSAAGRIGSVSFGDADSKLAVHVMQYLPPGQQPQLEPSVPMIQLFAVSGQVSWKEEGSGEFVVSAGQVLTIAGDGSPTLYEAGELPKWIVGKDLADIDRLASAELRRDLATDRPLGLSLLELTEFRQVEVRSLACRSLCSLDMFDRAIEALDGAKLRSYWYAQFDALRGALARSPESAIKLQRSLEKIAGDDAELMYELLCGFDPDQLGAGGAKELVDALESERVATRVLAYENLRRITDKTQLFRPEQPPAQQKGEVMKWRRNLSAGAILYQDPPAALPTRRAVTTDTSGESPATE